MFKQVYLYDGSPTLITTNKDGEYQYPNEAWTETSPPEGIYSPFYYNGNEWVGSTREEWEAQQEETQGGIYQPSNVEILLGQSQLQLAKSAVRINKLEKMQADAMLEIAKLKGEN